MKTKTNAKKIQEHMPAVHRAIAKVFKSKGLGNLRVTHVSLMSASEAPPSSNCAGHWEWRCEMTPQGYVCHWVCVPS